MKDRTGGSLDEALGKLSRDLPPPRDLWPGVVRGIVRTPRPPPSLSSVPWIAYAAAAAALVLAAALIWVTVGGRAPLSASGHGGTPAGPGTAASPDTAASPHTAATPDGPYTAGGPGNAVPSGAAFGEPDDPRYRAARAELERAFDQRLTQLDPSTRAKIEADLASIRKARDDIRTALAAQPDSPVLEQLLASALHDEWDLYDDVVRTTQPTARI